MQATYDDPDLKLYLKDIGQYPNGYSEAEERDLAERIARGDDEAKRALIEGNLRLVVFVAKKYKRPPQVTLLSLIQEGNLGLIRAVEDFDPDKGRFSTYATSWVKQSIGYAFPKLAQTIRLPLRISEAVTKVHKVIDMLYGRLEHEPSPCEIAEYTPFDEKRVKELLTWDRLPMSLDLPVNADSTEYELIHAPGDLLEDRDTPTPERALEILLLHEQIEAALAVISTRQRQLVELYCGFGNDEEADGNLAACARALGISREYARQLKNDAFKVLRSRCYQWQEN